METSSVGCGKGKAGEEVRIRGVCVVDLQEKRARWGRECPPRGGIAMATYEPARGAPLTGDIDKAQIRLSVYGILQDLFNR